MSEQERQGLRGGESDKNQITPCVGDVLQITKSNSVLGSEVLDLVKTADRISMQHDATKSEELSKDEEIDGTNVLSKD